MAAAIALVLVGIYLPQWFGWPWTLALVLAPIAAVMAFFAFLRPNQ